MTFSFSPKNNNNKRNKWNIKYTCTANTIYYKVYLLISMIINPGGVSSFNAFSMNELLNNFHYYCVIPEHIHTPSTPRKTLWFAPPRFSFPGRFLMTPLPPGISRIFKWGLLTTLGQTCQPPKGKNLEILNLKLGKVVRSGEKRQDVSITERHGGTFSRDYGETKSGFMLSWNSKHLLHCRWYAHIC